MKMRYNMKIGKNVSELDGNHSILRTKQIQCLKILRNQCDVCSKVIMMILIFFRMMSMDPVQSDLRLLG